MRLNQSSKEKQKDLKSIFWSFLENVPIALTVVLGAFAALISLFGSLSQTSLLFWTLTIVTLLATSELIVRFRRIYRIEDNTLRTVTKVDELTNQSHLQFTALQERVSINNVLITRKKILEFQKRITLAKEILLCGLTLSSITGSKYYKLIDDKIGEGTVVKFILLDPDYAIPHCQDKN